MAAVNPSDSDFGARIRLAREQRGISLRQIAETTKIAISMLEALERNDLSRLPGGISSRGFVRSYAVEIGVDPEQTVRDFLAQFPHDSVPVGSPHVIVDELGPGTRRLDPRALMLLGSIVLALAVFLYWTFTWTFTAQ